MDHNSDNLSPQPLQLKVDHFRFRDKKNYTVERDVTFAEVPKKKVECVSQTYCYLSDIETSFFAVYADESIVHFIFNSDTGQAQRKSEVEVFGPAILDNGLLSFKLSTGVKFEVKRCDHKSLFSSSIELKIKRSTDFYTNACHNQDSVDVTMKVTEKGVDSLNGVYMAFAEEMPFHERDAFRNCVNENLFGQASPEFTLRYRETDKLYFLTKHLFDHPELVKITECDDSKLTITVGEPYFDEVPITYEMELFTEKTLFSKRNMIRVTRGSLNFTHGMHASSHGFSYELKNGVIDECVLSGPMIPYDEKMLIWGMINKWLAKATK